MFVSFVYASFIRFYRMIICYFPIIANTSKFLQASCKNLHNLPMLTEEPRNVTSPILQSHDVNDSKEANFSHPLAPPSKVLLALDRAQDSCPYIFALFNRPVDFYLIVYATIFLSVLLMTLGRQIWKRKARIKVVRRLDSGDWAPQNNICKQQSSTTFRESELQSVIDGLQKTLKEKNKLIERLSRALSNKERKQAMKSNWSDTDLPSSYSEDKTMIRAEKTPVERVTSPEEDFINQRLRNIIVMIELMEAKNEEINLKQEQIREMISYFNKKFYEQEKYIDVMENENTTFCDILKQKQKQVEKVQKKCEREQMKQLNTSLGEAAADSAVSAGEDAPI